MKARLFSTGLIIGAVLLLPGCGETAPTIDEANGAANAYLTSSDSYWAFRNDCYKAFETSDFQVQSANVTSIGEMESIRSWWKDLGYRTSTKWPITVKVRLVCGNEGNRHNLIVEEHWSMSKYQNRWIAFHI